MSSFSLSILPAALRNAATQAAAVGHKEVVLYLCREVGVPIHFVMEDYMDFRKT